ncbi:MAG: MFS transporter [Burkholderiaceae bacterium]|nr:MFS transporter [Burkholderiaceae bacterium]
MRPPDTPKPPQPSPPAAPAATPAPRLTADRNLRWLMAGSLISLLGDQFSLLALPWAAMRLGGDAALVGTVLALVGAPRAVLILVGGAIVDRHGAQRVLMWSKHACTLLLATLAALVWSGALTPALLCLLALGLGVASAYGIPAATAMLPQTVAPALLAPANGLMMGLRQLSFFVGPLLAGGLIVVLGPQGGSAAAGPSADLGLAFALDAASFALSAWTLSQVRPLRPAAAAASTTPVLASLRQGLQAFWADAELRLCLLYWSAVAVLIGGPVQVAVPLLAASRADFGAGAFGAMLAAHGLGSLAGMGLAGARPGLRWGTLGRSLLAVDLVVGLLFLPMGRVQALWQAQGLLLLIGVLGGMMQVAVYTWMQQRVPAHLLGRAMGVFMAIFMGLVPLSAGLTGWLMRGQPVALVFQLAGGAVALLALAAALFTPLARVRDVAQRAH